MLVFCSLNTCFVAGFLDIDSNHGPPRHLFTAITKHASLLVLVFFAGLTALLYSVRPTAAVSCVKRRRCCDN